MVLIDGKDRSEIQEVLISRQGHQEQAIYLSLLIIFGVSVWQVSEVAFQTTSIQYYCITIHNQHDSLNTQAIFYFSHSFLSQMIIALMPVNSQIIESFCLCTPPIILLVMKLYKLMTIENISIELDDTCQAKDISRVKLRLLENGDPKFTHTTKHYAEIDENRLFWKENFEFRYKGQQKLVFQTYCEHEYGYNLQELQVLYEGVYYPKNQMFFKQDTCHIYTPQGQIKGFIRWEIKVLTKEEDEVAEEKVEKVIPLVREDLIGLIKIEEAYLEITNPIFNKKKYHHCDLKIQFGDQIELKPATSDFKWTFKEIKLEYIIDGPNDIYFELFHEHRPVFEGTTKCENIEKMRRYIQYRVGIFNKNGVKIGSLVLDFRYVTKQQLLDLIYSPNNKLSYTQKSQSHSQLALDEGHHTFMKKIKGQRHSSKKHVSFFHDKHLTPQDRYKIGYLMNQNSDIIIPKSPRFKMKKANSPYISYIDPEKSSDFSPKNHRGWNISRGKKFDFTRQYKGNPGVGEYKLPSIWSKY